MVNITQIFDEDTQYTIRSVEKFFKQIVKNKMYWTRDILQFFGISDDDISVFLSFHQIYVYSLNQKFQRRSLQNVNFREVAGRAGSYWNANNVYMYDSHGTAKFETFEDEFDSENHSTLRGNQSFHVNLNRADFSIKENYIYGDSSSAAE